MKWIHSYLPETMKMILSLKKRKNFYRHVLRINTLQARARNCRISVISTETKFRKQIAASHALTVAIFELLFTILLSILFTICYSNSRLLNFCSVGNFLRMKIFRILLFARLEREHCWEKRCIYKNIAEVKKEYNNRLWSTPYLM